MKKLIIIALLVMGVTGMAYASNVDDFLKGDEGDIAFNAKYGIEAEFVLNEGEKLDKSVITGLNLRNEIDNWRTPDITIEAIYKLKFK